MPFILRRTKENSLPELPPKIVVDVFCPLSLLQRRLYAKFQIGLQLSDDLLEKELIAHLPVVGTGPLPVSAMISAQAGTSGKYHPFQALSYLKRLCVDPSLIKDQCDVATSAQIEDDNSISTSGKLCKLVEVLIKENVILHSDHSSQARVERILQRSRESHIEFGSHDLVSEDADSASSDDSDNQSVMCDDLEPEDADTDASVARDRHPTGLASSVETSFPQRRKCLIFAEHRTTLDVIKAKVFDQYFPHERILLLDGRLGANTRAQLAADFNSGVTTDSSPSILLLTVGSCGLGLNLSAAEIVIFIEHSWNPFVDLQAMDRVHRIGQLKRTIVYRILGIIAGTFYFCHLIITFSIKIKLTALLSRG